MENKLGNLGEIESLASQLHARIDAMNNDIEDAKKPDLKTIEAIKKKRDRLAEVLTPYNNKKQQIYNLVQSIENAKAKRSRAEADAQAFRVFLDANIANDANGPLWPVFEGHMQRNSYAERIIIEINRWLAEREKELAALKAEFEQVSEKISAALEKQK